MRQKLIILIAAVCFLFNSQQVNAEKVDRSLDVFPKIASIQKIKDRGVLKVAMHKKDHPPFFMVDDQGDLIGIDVELAQLLAKQLGVKLEFDRSKDNFNEVVALVASRKCDLSISKISITMPRSEILLYTKPYTTMNKSLLLNRAALTQLPADINIKKLFQLQDLKLGVVSNSSYEAFANRLVGEDRLFSDPSWSEVIIPKLLKGEIMAAFRDEVEVRRTMYSVKDAPLNLIAVNIADETDPISIVVHVDDLLFKQYLDNFIEVVFQERKLSNEIERFDEYLRKEQDV